MIRAREIHWNEAHTCHATKQDALDNLEAAWASYLYLLNDCLGVYGLRIRRPEWDKFAGAEHTDVLDCILPSGKVLQSVGAHYLGQIFSKPFDIKFTNEKTEFEHAYMTCYGVSTRMLACALSAHGDDRGLVLPSKIARYQVVIVPILMKKDREAVLEACAAYEKQFLAAGIRVFFDDSEKTPPEKYYHWEMKGVPIRMEVGPRDLKNNQVMFVRRDGGGKTECPAADVIVRLQELLKTQDDAMFAKAKAFHEDHVTTCGTLQEATDVLKSKGGFVRVPFFTTGKEGEEGDKIIHEATGGEVRGFVIGDEIEPGKICVATGRPATTWAYVAKSY